MIAFLFPGQGSQHVGMGRALVDGYPEARGAFEEADAALGEPLSALCFDGPDDRLTLTENTQPAIVAASIAAYRVLQTRGIAPAFVAGHSLGEYTANVVAGTITFADALRTVRQRGRFMQEAVPVGAGAMAAILGLDAETVRRACEDASQGEVVSPANINGAKQVVIAGTRDAVLRAGERAKALGARRVVPLPVSAPFHCRLMMSAQERLAPVLRGLVTHQPRVPIIANVDATPKRDAVSAIDALIRQVSAPVLWDQVVQRLASEGVTTYVEVGPGSVLAGLVRKIHKDASVFNVATAEDVTALDAALAGLQRS